MPDPFEELRQIVEEIAGARLAELPREEFAELWTLLGEVMAPGGLGPLDALRRDAARFERAVGEATVVLQDIDNEWVRLFMRNGVSQR